MEGEEYNGISLIFWEGNGFLSCMQFLIWNLISAV